MKGFQAAVIIFFGILVFLGVLIFSGIIKLPGKSSGGTAQVSSIKIWGTIPKKSLETSIRFLNSNGGGPELSYQEKDPRNYEEEILNAFAFGGVPDLFLITQDLIKKYEDKIILIPYTYFPERTFDDTYIRAAEVYKRPEGFLGFPIFSDPLVMYYNKDLLEAEGYVAPPKYWKELFSYVPKLTKKNEALQITTAGVALGEFENIKNAKEILVAMNLQLGNPIIVYNSSEGRPYSPVFADASPVSARPATQSLVFFGEFSNSVKDVYSWNKSQSNSQSAFVAGDLAIYFGLASEFRNIQQKNPNLNFDVAMIPQVEELKNKITYSDVYAFAIPRNSPNAQIALSIAADLANGLNTANLIAPTGFSPMRRDLIASSSQKTKYDVIFHDAALNSRSWIDFDDAETTRIFSNMVESVSSGLETPEKAIDSTQTEFRRLLSK